MKKFSWDMQKIRQIKNSLNSSEIRNNSELYEELLQVYEYLIYTYKIDKYIDEEEFEVSNFKEYFIENILPYTNMEALSILEGLEPEIKSCRRFNIDYKKTRLISNNEQLFYIVDSLFKSIPNRNIYNSFLELTNEKENLINIQYVKEITNCHGFCIIDSYNHIPYSNIFRNNTTVDIIALFHEIFHMIIRKNQEANHINSKSSIYDETEGYFANLLIYDLARELDINEKYFIPTITSDLRNVLICYPDIIHTIPFIKNINNKSCDNKYINPSMNEDISTIFAYLCALDFYELYKNNPEKTIDSLMNLTSLKGESIKSELSEIGINFFEDKCANLKKHHLKIKKLNHVI